MEMRSQSESSVLNKRYILQDTIGSGGMGSVVRARDRLTGATIAIKQLAFTPDVLKELTVSGLDLPLAIAREFELLASLRHPNIISVLDYGFDANRQPYFAMELLTDVEPVITYGQHQQQDAQVRLFVQMLQALAYLHRRGVLHRDLKPDNVLVTRDGTVKLLDFGLAGNRQQISADPIAGTLPYMAPELITETHPPSEAADLYAVGLITYQMLTGRYPFDTRETLDVLLNDIANKPVPVDTVDAAPALIDILKKLLAKTPGDRYQDAESVLADLSQHFDTSIVGESRPVRESFLQAAQFIGRDAELQRLTDALDVMQTGSGSSWLIGGESGVGKTRLLNEIRIQALTRGATVLQAQAQVESSSPFLFWRAPLRYLALLEDITDYEASVLQAVIPDIETLLDRPVASAPELDPKSAEDRLINVIEALLARYTAPIVLLLEDLQWITAGLTIIQRVANVARFQPLLVIGTFRDDERPELVAELPNMTLIKLDRLEADEIADLSASMLGEGSGRRADLITFLQQETEGNIFFLVETVRALAEEAGQLRAIGQVDLPDHIITSGVRNVIERRLSRINPSDRDLLEIAAVAGRDLDLSLLRETSGESSLTGWLSRCASVLTVSGNRWRFAHDKLREGTLASIDPADLPLLHQRVAEGIQVIYGDDPDQLALQAYHWGQAGNTEREAYFSARAGEQLLKQGGYGEARHLLERADVLVTDLNWTNYQRARLKRNLAEACMGSGKPFSTLDYLQATLQLMGVNPPASRVESGIRWTVEVARQFAHRVGLRLPHPLQNLPTEQLHLITEAEIDLAYNYPEQTLNIYAGLLYNLSAANLQESVGDSTALAGSYAMLASSLLTAGQGRLAQFYAERASQLLAQPTDNPATEATALSNLAYYWTFVARWHESTRDGERSIKLYEQVGDLVRARSTLMNLAVTREWQGDFVGGLEIRQRELETAQRADSLVGKIRALAGVGQMQAYLGHNAEALETLLERKRLIEIVGSTASTRFTYLAMAYWRLGDTDNARTMLPLGVEEIDLIVSPSAHDMFSTSNTAEVALGMWEREGDNPVYQDYARRAIRVTQLYGKLFPSGEPHMLTFYGLYQWLSGNHEEAVATWHTAIRLAREIKAVYAEALASYELGRHLPSAAPERAERLGLARERFTQIGANWNLRQLDTLLSN